MTYVADSRDQHRAGQRATATPEPGVEGWLIAALCEAASRPSSAAAPDVARLLAAARAAGLSAVLFHTLRDAPGWAELPEGLRIGLSGAAKQAIAWEVISHAAVREALDALAAHGIDCLLLKGTPLAHLLYPAPYCRPRGDTDLLFADRAAAERAWQVLRALGYQRYLGVQGRYVSHQFSCVRPGPNETALMFDIHWRLSNSNFFAQRFSFSELWAARRPVSALGPHAQALSSRHALIHALFHRAWHLGRADAVPLIWLYDMHLLCTSFGDEDWAAFAAEVEQRGLQPICRAGLQDLHSAFGTAIPPDVDAALAATPPRGLLNQMHLLQPGLRRKLADLMSLPSWRQRLGLLRETLLPDADYMRRRFGVRARWQLPAAYLRRALRGLRKAP